MADQKDWASAGVENPMFMEKRGSTTTWLLCGIALSAPWQILAMFQPESDGYLTKVGPSPLHYQADCAASTSLPALPPIEIADNETAASDAAVSGDFISMRRPFTSELLDRFFLPTPVYFTRLSGNTLAGVSTPADGNPANSGTTAESTASDLLNVTPEMLVDYFKPEQPSTNAVSSMDRGLLDFLPASPAVWGSSAVYKSQ